MKKITFLLIVLVMMLSVSTQVFAEREYIGETVVKDNMLFINGNSISATQLPNEFVYLPVEHLEYYGFDVLYNNDNGYKEYVIRRNGSTDFVPEFTYNAERYKDYTKVYSTDAKVYLDSDIPANVFELENRTVDTNLTQKYINENSNEYTGTLRDVTPDDAKVIPTTNLLNTDGASDWAKEDIEKAAACNLLPYELASRYTSNITRKDFCDLIYRLVATEFSPNSDSRQGEWFAIDNIISERQLINKINSVSFSDCTDDTIKFYLPQVL